MNQAGRWNKCGAGLVGYVAVLASLLAVGCGSPKARHGDLHEPISPSLSARHASSEGSGLGASASGCRIVASGAPAGTKELNQAVARGHLVLGFATGIAKHEGRVDGVWFRELSAVKCNTGDQDAAEIEKLAEPLSVSIGI